MNLCRVLGLEATELEQADAVLEGLFQEVAAFQGRFRSKELLPLQLDHDALIALENDIDNCDNTSRRAQLLHECNQLKSRMRGHKLSLVFQKILEASSMPNFVSVVRLFVMQLKQFISPSVNRIRNKILEVRGRTDIKEKEMNRLI